MKKKLSLTICFIFMLIAIFSVASSNVTFAAELTDQQKITNELNAVSVPERAIIDFPVVSVSAYGSTITWESNNQAVLNVPATGGWVIVTRPSDADVTVELKLTLTRGAVEDFRTFNVLVRKGTTQVNTYNISYVLNGGNNHANNPATYNVGTTPTLYAPTKGTVGFLGWYDNAEFNGSAITALPKGLSGNVVLYAKWEPAVVTSIEITKAPDKVTYNALENFDKTGMIVKVYYNDETSTVLDLNDVVIDKTQLTGTDTSVTVSFGGKSDTQAITVNKLNYDMSQVTLSSDTKVYNGTAQALAISGTLPTGVTVKNYEGSGTNVGTYQIKVNFEVADTVNYNVPSSLEATLTISQAEYDFTALGITFTNASKTYNGNVQNLAISGNLPTGVEVSYSNGIKNVGQQEITATFTVSDPVNYKTPTAMKATLTIEAKALTITANTKYMIFGANVPSFDVTYDGFVTGENEDVLTGTLSFSCEATSTSEVGQYPITVSGVTGSNYDISFVPGTLHINSGSYTIEVAQEDLTVTYNGSNQMFEAVLKDNNTVIPGIVFTYTLNNQAFTGATNANTYRVNISYADATYGTGSTSVDFVIEQAEYDLAALGITFTDASKTYNGNVQNLAISGNLPTGVEVSYSNGIKNVGQQEITATFTVSDPVNYKTPTAMKATLTIEARPLEESMFEAISAHSYTGSAITPAVVGSYANAGLVLNTDFTVVYSDNTNQGTAKVTVTGIGNFSGEIELRFEIGASDLEKVAEAKTELETAYSTSLSGTIDLELSPLSLVATNGSTIYWMSSSTAIGVNPTTGALSFNLTETTQLATLTAIIVNGDAAEYAVFNITLPEAPVEGLTIVDVIAKPDNEAVEFNATVTAIHARGYVVTDATGSIMVYYGSTFTPEFSVGDNVKVVGTTGTYNKGRQIATPTVTTLGTTTTISTTPRVLSATDLDAIKDAAAITSELVSLTGTLSTSGSNYNINVTGTTASVGSIYYPTNASEITALNGKKVTIVGYVVSNSGTKYINIVITSISETQLTDTEKVADDKLTLTLPSEVTADFTLPSEGLNGSTITWQVTSGTAIVINGSTATVTRPAAGEANAEVTLLATITNGLVVDTKAISVTVKAAPVVGSTVYKQATQISELVAGAKIIILAKRSSGNYYYLTSDIGTASTKRYTAIDSGLATISDISEINEAAVWEIEAKGTNFVLKSNLGTYMKWQGGSVNGGTLDVFDNATALTITDNDATVPNTFQIQNAADSARYIAFNGSTGNDYFGFYKNTQADDLVIMVLDTGSSN